MLLAHVLVAVLAVSGSLSIDEQRCPAGVAAGAPGCAAVRARVTYASAPRPPARHVAGAIAFAKGLRVTVRGQGRCEGESPQTITTAPDGSVQILGPDSRVVPFTSTALTLLVDPHPHAVRFAWLDPLEPPFACRYLGDTMGKLAVPTTAGLVPRRLATGWIAARTLSKRRSVVVLSGAKTWTATTTDALSVSGQASWQLRLELGHVVPSQPNFAG